MVWALAYGSMILAVVVGSLACVSPEVPEAERADAARERTAARERLAVAAEAADDQLLAFAECLEGGDPGVPTPNYLDCLSTHLDGLAMQAGGYADRLQRLARQYEGRMQDAIDRSDAAKDDDARSVHLAAYADLLSDMARDVRAMIR